MKGVKKYMHIESYGNIKVQGIESGECFVFPKIDGINSSVWLESHKICASSRNRELTEASDNAGFYAFVKNDDRFKEFFKLLPNLRLYGEWYLKTYKFYIFDVLGNFSNEYIHYNEYKKWLDDCGLDYIPPICSIENGSFEKFAQELENNKFLKGIVIKNYAYRNQWGRQCFAKINNQM